MSQINNAFKYSFIPQMSPIHWLILMFDFFNLPSKEFSLTSLNSSMNWMW